MDKQHEKCREKNNSATYEYSKVTQLNKMNIQLSHFCGFNLPADAFAP